MIKLFVFASLSILCLSIAYDINRSKLIDKYACIIHCSKEQIVDWSCKICSTTPKVTEVVYIKNNRTNVVGYVGYSASDKEIIVSFQGTKDAKNWLEDFDFTLTNYPKCKGCQVHQGFYFDYLSVHNELLAIITKLFTEHPDAHLLVTGSSLGSALATIAALELELVFRKQTELHSFGCPRVGNSQYASFLSQNIANRIRVVHNRDIVPHIPFLAMGYHHYAYEVLFDEAMKNYQVCDSSG